jgi:hypothetical protein
MSVQPISPSEALELKITTIPDEIIETVNAMLTERMTRNAYITITQDAIIDRALALFEQRGKTMTRQEIFGHHWMDFEPFYEKAGWKVVYDKPGYCESYAANFTFTRKD